MKDRRVEVSKVKFPNERDIFVIKSNIRADLSFAFLLRGCNFEVVTKKLRFRKFKTFLRNNFSRVYSVTYYVYLIVNHTNLSVALAF